MTLLPSPYEESYPPFLFAGGDPRISSLAPNTASASAGPTTVTVNGSNFEADSVVEIDGVAQTTTFVSASRLTVSYDPSTAGTFVFTVRNASNLESNDSPFVVTAIAATGVTAGAPGAFTPSGATPPATIGDLRTAIPSPTPATAWTTDQYVEIGSGNAYWNGTDWAMGKAP